MKKTKLLYILSALCGLLLFFACTSEDDVLNFPNGTSAKLLPVKIVGEDHGSETVFEYDDLNRLTRYLYSYLASDAKLTKGNELKIQYGDEGRIKKVIALNSNEELYNYDFSYNTDGSTITIADKQDPDGRTTLIDVDSRGNVLRKTEMSRYYVLPSIIYYEYDQQGNINKQKWNNQIETYRYDTKNGIFSHVNTPQWFLVTILGENRFIYNNCTEIRISYIKEDNTESEPSLFKITYKYNENGYPYKYHVPNMSFCGTPPLPESNYRVKYREASPL